MKHEAERNSNEAARRSFYEEEAEAGSFLSPHYNQRVLGAMLEPLAPTSIAEIRDVGAGSGSNLPTLRALFPAARLAAFDLNAAALASARRAAERVAAARSDVAFLPLADGSADLVVCTEVLEHVANLAAAVAEIARVVRPGGHALLSSPNYRNPMGARKWWNDRKRGDSYWDPWGGHPGFERLMLPGMIEAAARAFFDVVQVRGAGYVMAWVPFGYGRVGRLNDRHPLVGLGRLPFFRDVAMNRFLLLRRRRGSRGSGPFMG